MAAQLFVILVPGDSTPSCGLWNSQLYTGYTDMHADRTPVYIKVNKNIIRRLLWNKFATSTWEGQRSISFLPGLWVDKGQRRKKISLEIDVLHLLNVFTFFSTSFLLSLTLMTEDKPSCISDGSNKDSWKSPATCDHPGLCTWANWDWKECCPQGQSLVQHQRPLS